MPEQADRLSARFDLLVDFAEIDRERDTSPSQWSISGDQPAGGQGGEIIRILHAHESLTADLPDG